ETLSNLKGPSDSKFCAMKIGRLPGRQASVGCHEFADYRAIWAWIQFSYTTGSFKDTLRSWPAMLISKVLSGPCIGTRDGPRCSGSAKKFDSFAVFTDLSTAVDWSESASSLERTGSGGRSPTSVSTGASLHSASLARGAARP